MYDSGDSSSPSFEKNGNNSYSEQNLTWRYVVIDVNSWNGVNIMIWDFLSAQIQFPPPPQLLFHPGLLEE